MNVIKRKIFYTYSHFDPHTKEIVYIGYGSGGRAWNCGSNFSTDRGQPHYQWFDSWFEQGFTPDQMVEILNKGLTASEALEQETALIRKFRPIFNKTIRKTSLKANPEKYYKALNLREQGLSYNKIGKEIGLSTMTTYNCLNNKPISLEIALDE